MSKRNIMIIASVVAVALVAGGTWLALTSRATAPSEALKTAGSVGNTTTPTLPPELLESGEATASAEASEQVDAGFYTPIPVDGPHEKAALLAVPGALKTAADKKKELKLDMPDLSSAGTAFTSYGIIATMDGRNYLFQVLADGKAYEYLRYPKQPDPKNQYSLDVAGFAGEPLVDPSGTRETAAASAVQVLMDKAFGKGKAKVKIWNYGFTFVKKDGKPATLKSGVVFQITVSPAGKLATME